MRLRWKTAAVVTTCMVLTAACGSSSKKTNGTASATTATTASSGGSATTAPASSYPPIPPGPIKFGISTPLTGAQAAFGQTTAESFNNITLKAFNMLHPDGIDGHPVQYSVLDDASDVTKAVGVANQFVAEKLAGVLTVSYNPAAYVQQLAVLNKGKIPVIANLGDPQFANTTLWPYDFGVDSTQQQEAVVAAQYIGRKGYTRIATINDGIPSAVSQLGYIVSSMKQYTPNAQVVKAVTVAAGSTDDTTAVAQLKASNPDLLINVLSYGYAPLWQAMQTAGWSPNILSHPSAWYDGFTGMGSLVNKAVAFYNACADSPSQTWPPDVAALMTSYSKATGGLSTNYLTYVISDSIPLELFKYAIEKYHSLDPDAIKKALEGVNQQFFGAQFTITPTNHFGLTGQYGAAVCNMGPPYAGGDAKVPVKAS